VVPVVPDNINQVDNQIYSNHCITEDITSTLSIGTGNVMAMTEGLGCSKVYGSSVPRTLTDVYMESMKLCH
jgi:hypothetical protein